MERNEAAASLGRRGGLARAKNLDGQRRKQIARQAAITRWGLQRPDRDRMVARLTIALQVDPDVERRLEVPLSIRLDQLHRVFQAALGWQDYHLYAFFAGNRSWRGPTYLPGDEPVGKRPVGNAEIVSASLFRNRGTEDAKPADAITLAGFLETLPKKSFIYTYDFGDDWEHKVKVTGLANCDPLVTYPRLISAIGRCPPEDVGGPWGYRDYVEAITNPSHPKHDQLVKWSKDAHGIEMPFDPNFADSAAIQKRLHTIREVTIRSVS